MATDVFINIKDLPELTEVRNGDYIIVESTTGTHLIDFKNLIMPTANTIITNTVTQNTNAILSLSSSNSSSTLSSQIESNKTDISSLSTNISNIVANKILNLNVAKTQVTISPGNIMGTDTLSQTGNWEISDIIITPANDYAAKYTAYPISIDTSGRVSIQANFTRTVLALTNTSPSIAVESSLRPSTTPLSSYTVLDYTNSLKLNPSDLNDFLTSFTLSSIETTAENPAIYNVFAIKP